MEHRWTTNKLFDDVAKTVCVQCNSEWMSDVEIAAKPYLRPMIEGDVKDEPLTLNREAQEAIATWIALRAIVIRSTHTPPTPALLERWFDWMYTKRTCPENWCIWIAAYVGDLVAQWEAHTLHPFKHQEAALAGQRGILDTSIFTGLITTAFIGHFAFKVIGLGSGQPLNIRGNALARIAPFKRELVEWPPSSVITNDTIIPFFKAGSSSESTLEKHWDEIQNV